MPTSTAPYRIQHRDKNDGPFLFQAKFIQGTSAHGRPSQQLLHAVQAERRRITARIHRGTWAGAQHYVLLTNVTPSPQTRAKIHDSLLAISNDMSVHIHGGADICDMLDRQPSLRRAFPQLLSIRDLQHLLSSIVNKAVLERSRLACDFAADLAPVFVPTSAYEHTWRVLQQYRFAVLEGLPKWEKPRSHG